MNARHLGGPEMGMSEAQQPVPPPRSITGDISTLGDAIGLLSSLMATDSRDWSADPADARLYGIVVGWDRDPDDHDDLDGAWSEVAARHGWSDTRVATLRRAHAQFAAIGTRS